MLMGLLALGAGLLQPATVKAQAPAGLPGVWEGALQISGIELRIVFHITQDAEGNLHATMDSPDQGATGIPVNKVSFKKSKLKLEVDAVRGKFIGKYKPDKQRIEGEWGQGGRWLRLDLERTGEAEAAPVPAAPPEPVSKSEAGKIAGMWQGTLKVSGIELRLVFHIKADDEGRLSATMDSPDQGAKDIPTSRVAFAGNTLTVEVNSVGGKYEGELDPKTGEISGSWTQMGRSLALDLHRVDKAPVLRRPQEPKKPYPYDEEEVQYENKAAGVTLAGTLTRPKGDGPFPAVLLISGSGPQNRDEFLLGHKPFLVLADYLTRRGIAVLRVDDRGVGKSTGDFAAATSEDFAGDALAGVAYLKSRSDIHSGKIGLIGHSEGGIIAPMAATQSKDVAFIVLLAGPGLPGEQILYMQQEKIFRAMGASEELIAWNHENSRKIYAILKAEADDSAAAQKLRAYSESTDKSMPEALKQEVEKISGQKVGENRELGIKQMLSPWFRFFLTYDPRPALSRVSCPVLALIGEKDLQVPADENLEAITTALKAGGNKRFEVKKLSGLNHLFQTADTGAPSEYGKIEETMSPKAMEVIAQWILQVTKR